MKPICSRLVCSIVILLGVSLSASAQVPRDRLGDGIARATELMTKGVKNYPEHRSCFSCHHQALPLLALSVGSLGEGPLGSDKADFYSSPTTKQILEFTEQAFSNKLDTLNSGGEIGGRALTVAYALWTMDLAGSPSNKTTSAMVESLLKTQGQDGAWSFQSTRPPAASSKLMTTAIAVYGLRSYGHDATDGDRLKLAMEKSLAWSLEQSAASHEDLVGQIWLEHMIAGELGNGDEARAEELLTRLRQLQRDDGGWAQENELASDAYATGQAVMILSQVQGRDRKEQELTRPVERAVEFLLKSQQPDGSWHVASRSKPVQVFFDNGDPHGKDQFISMMATSWATAALREFRYQTGQPLESVRVANRLQAR